MGLPQATPPLLPGSVRTMWSCVLDDRPATWSACVAWLATALGPGGIAASDLVVHHVAPLRPDIASLCTALGVRTVAVAPFDARSPRCNKLRQADTAFDAQRVVLMDADMAFTARLPLEQVIAPVAGKLVDAAHPPLRVLQGVFGAAGLRMPERCANTTREADDRRATFDTCMGHFNGGLYVVDAVALRDTIGPAWTRWTRWLLDRAGLLERWRAHVDEVAFALAIAECGLPAQALPGAWNFPLQVRTAPMASAPIVLHHGGPLDAHMRLDARRAPGARKAVARANAAIVQFQRTWFDNRTFWNHRYTAHPALGSGLGSRGAALAAKRGCLALLAAPERSLLDWGCGDLEATRAMSCDDGTGVDVATESLRVARGKRGDWSFLTPAQFDAIDGRPRDLVVCLDVLVHQRHREDYVALLHRLASLAHLGLVVSGYDARPTVQSPIAFFHEPLRTTLASIPEVIDLVPLQRTRDTTLYFAATSEAGRTLIHEAHAEACTPHASPRASP